MLYPLTLNVVVAGLAFGDVQADQNAADLYIGLQSRLNAVPQDAWLEMHHWLHTPSVAPTDEVESALGALNDVRQQLFRAAAIPDCNFAIEQTGPATAIPHQGVMSRGSLLLLADAQWRLQRNEARAASDAIGTVFGMASHMSSDRISHSSHKATWMILDADRVIQHAVDIGAVNQAHARTLLTRMDIFDRSDPTGIADAAEAMIEPTLGWFIETFESGDFESLETLLRIYPSYEGIDFDHLDPKEFTRAVETASEVLHSAAAELRVADPDDAKRGIEEILARVQDDELVSQLFPWLSYEPKSWLWQRETALDVLAKRRAMLEGIASGEIGIEETANAAYWYLRGAEQIAPIPEDAWEKLLHFGSHIDDDVHDGEMLRRQYSQVERAMDIFREGARIHRCDFAPLRLNESARPHSLIADPIYAEGIWRAVEFLIARHQNNTEADAGDFLADLISCSSMIVHLSGDDLIMSSYIAHESFRQVKRIIDVTEHGDISQTTFDAVAQVIGQLRDGDPFGYSRSLQKTRSNATAYFAAQFAAAAASSCDPGDAPEIIARWNNDQLFVATLGYHAGSGLGATDAQGNDIRAGQDRPQWLHRHLERDILARYESTAHLYTVLISHGFCVIVPLFDPPADIEIRNRSVSAQREFADLLERRQPMRAKSHNDQ